VSRRRSRRWQPDGTGWITTYDYGSTAVWMRPVSGGRVEIALYSVHLPPGLGPDTAEVWVVRVPVGSWLPGEVMDKPWRIRWAVEVSQGDEFAGEVLLRRVVVPSHAGHRRLNANRRVWRWPLPRKIRRALGDR
jgi:hypothetical protein